jgi:hypothetical protein
MKNVKINHFIQDIFIIIASIGCAILLIKTESIYSILATSQSVGWLGSFIAGLFFTSIFTTAPAIVALGEISQVSSILFVAFFGACGAVVGDLIIFKFVKDRFSDDLMELVKLRKEGRKIKIKNNLPIFKWFSFFIGGLIIASPLPDELGIGFLGFSKLNMKLFIPVSFIFNFIGIVLIGIVANSA